MKDYVLISSSKYSEVISFMDIIFIQADGSYSKVIMNNNKSLSTSKNLSSFEKVIPGDCFLRVHRSYIVNLKYLRKIYNNEDKIVLNNIEIPVSRSKKRILWEKINSYIQIF